MVVFRFTYHRNRFYPNRRMLSLVGGCTHIAVWIHLTTFKVSYQPVKQSDRFRRSSGFVHLRMLQYFGYSVFTNYIIYIYKIFGKFAAEIILCLISIILRSFLSTNFMHRELFTRDFSCLMWFFFFGGEAPYTFMIPGIPLKWLDLYTISTATKPFMKAAVIQHPWAEGPKLE